MGVRNALEICQQYTGYERRAKAKTGGRMSAKKSRNRR